MLHLIDGKDADEKKKEGNNMMLINYRTAEIIRLATASEIAESLAAGAEGVIMVDGVPCYVG